MNVVDSSGWLEYFANGPNAGFFAPAVERPAELLVPTLSLFEAFKRILQQRDETSGLQAIAMMQQGLVIDLTVPIALGAARISLDLRLPMADSVMLASAKAYDATFWTQDAHFEGMEGVRYTKAR